MEREARITQNSSLELAKKKSESLMTQSTRDIFEKRLVEAEQRLKEARESRIPTSEDGRDQAAADYSFRQHVEADLEVKRLRNILSSSRLISPRQQTDVIKMGNSAMVRLLQEDITIDVTMLGKHDIAEGAIHLGQPLADAIYGRKAGDIVTFAVGKNQLSAEVMKVLPGDFEPPRDPEQRKSS